MSFGNVIMGGVLGRGSDHSDRGSRDASQATNFQHRKHPIWSRYSCIITWQHSFGTAKNGCPPSLWPQVHGKSAAWAFAQELTGEEPSGKLNWRIVRWKLMENPQMLWSFYKETKRLNSEQAFFLCSLQDWTWCPCPHGSLEPGGNMVESILETRGAKPFLC